MVLQRKFFAKHRGGGGDDDDDENMFCSELKHFSLAQKLTTIHRNKNS
jgi:hypothetical protein